MRGCRDVNLVGRDFVWLTTAVVLSAACRAVPTESKDATEAALEDTLVDNDGDGFSDDEDCNDAAPDVGPGIAEVCNGIDDDCDGLVDEDVKDIFYADADGDGFGSAADTVEACEAPSGYVPSGTDCDDSEASVFPGNIETCDEVDNDCDSEVDEDLWATWYLDADGDGFGDPDALVEACEMPSGHVDNAADCNDDSDDTYPGAEELCDERDNDCDSEVDEGLLLTWYRDGDGDEWGVPSESTEACAQPNRGLPGAEWVRDRQHGL
ncbi:MAG: hypothetical protein CL927_12415 [Deltaproteobacteria bacterium]|nr:hypothetical protein [Deltaproteobacteria bacterium]HCH63336.1 hypothetical protein [Deltaproteobacteria bacterium]